MATESAADSVHNTLSGTTADEITLTGGHQRAHVINRSTSTALYVRHDGTTAVAEANGTHYVAPGGYLEVPADAAISIVGNGNAYSVEAIR